MLPVCYQPPHVIDKGPIVKHWFRFHCYHYLVTITNIYLIWTNYKLWLIFFHVHFFSQKDENGWTPLLMAASSGNMEILRWLITRGADVAARTPKEFNAIHVAALSGHVDIMVVCCLAILNCLSKFHLQILLHSVLTINESLFNICVVFTLFIFFPFSFSLSAAIQLCVYYVGGLRDFSKLSKFLLQHLCDYSTRIYKVKSSCTSPSGCCNQPQRLLAVGWYVQQWYIQ